jgi:hypothetical protein
VGTTLLEKTRDISIDDFTTGWIAGLASLGVSAVRLEPGRFYRAIVSAYDEFVGLCEERNLRPRFVIQQTEHYEDSPDFRSALERATARDLVSLDSPDFINMRLQYSCEDAHFLFRYLIGGEELYIPVARAFRRAYAA